MGNRIHINRAFITLQVICIFLFSTTFNYVHAYTQYSSAPIYGLPMGHEWIARLAFFEVIGANKDPEELSNDPNDPRTSWNSNKKAKNMTVSQQYLNNNILNQTVSDSTFAPQYHKASSAIYGVRWVDLGGFAIANRVNRECFFAVAQDPAELQYDHFMRKYTDEGGQGGLDATQGSIERFKNHFITAAMQPSMDIKINDGGAVQGSRTVDYNYFLLGRAMHLLQDSFSSEHVVRKFSDDPTQIRQVKSYMCASGAEQHDHNTDDFRSNKAFKGGDAIWKPSFKPSGWKGYKASNMKDMPLVAVEATKDLWAAFIRTMAQPINERESYARAEADTIVNNWMKYNAEDMKKWYQDENNRDDTYVLQSSEGGKGQTVKQCMKSIDSGIFKTPEQKNRHIKSTQKNCIYTLEKSTDNDYKLPKDPYLRIPYFWDRKGFGLSDAPDGYTIPEIPNKPLIPAVAPTVKIKSVATGNYITRDSDEYFRTNDTGSEVEFIFLGTKDNMRVQRKSSDRYLTWSANNYLSDSESTDRSDNGSTYQLIKKGDYWVIQDVYWKQYWGSYDGTFSSGYVQTKETDPDSDKAKWIIEGLTDAWLNQ